LTSIVNLLAFMGQAPDGGSGSGSPMMTFVMLGGMVLIFWLFILRPQQKKQKDRQKLLESVKKGDKVITIGGIHGTVVGVEEKTLLVQIADNVKVKYDRSAVSTILSDTENSKPIN
jgi:preprotein translocase subunit YajC